MVILELKVCIKNKNNAHQGPFNKKMAEFQGSAKEGL